MKKVIVFTFWGTLIAVIMFQFSEFVVTKEEALLRGFGATIFGFCLYYAEIVERNWVTIRLRFIHKFGHLSGIMAHTILGSTLWVIGLTVIVTMIISKNMEEFWALFIAFAIFFSSNVYSKKNTVDKAFTEGTPLDMQGNIIWRGIPLKYWDPHTKTFVKIGNKWWQSDNGLKIYFRTGPKGEVTETRYLHDVMVYKPEK